MIWLKYNARALIYVVLAAFLGAWGGYELRGSQIDTKEPMVEVPAAQPVGHIGKPSILPETEVKLNYEFLLCGHVIEKTEKDGEFIKLPEGIAHYLEHKLFESEECSAFERYAKTGASANAYTSFDRTGYLFSCSDNFSESLEILLDFVTHPYFTAETVAKEQGIIGQEIRMYDDSPDWRVLFNLLCALYSKNPVRIDIAGTQESISHITAGLLYKCYDKFYNLHNMVLAAAGDINVDEVISAADKILKPAEPFFLERGSCGEPEEVVQNYTEQHLPVSVPMFSIGFKGKPGTEKENFKGSVLDEIFIDALFDDYTPAYRSLYDEGVINSTFGATILRL